jgi:ABC-type molybdate transport system ATPase subunit
MLAGLSMEARGTIRLKDRLWQDSEKAVFVAARDREIGFVPPEDGLFPHLDIENNLIAGIDRADRLPKENRISPTRVINTLELAKVRMSYRRELKRRDLSDLNAYERRRVSLAMALISSPAMLIIDDGEGPEAAARSHMMKEDYLKVMATWPELPIIIASPDPELVAAMKNSYGASAERVDPISSTRLGPHPSPGADPTTTAGVSSPIA